MIIKEKNRYLKIPVCKDANETKIFFYSGDVLLRDITVCVDFERPDYTAYYDLKTFMGMDITIKCDAGDFEISDSIEYREDDKIT